MERFIFEVTEEENQRLDKFISDYLPEISRSYVQKLITDGFIRINEKTVKANYKLKDNDIIIAEIPEPEPIKIEAEKIPLDIVYEDRDLLVVNKAIGMTVHPAAGNYSGTLVNALLAHCTDLSGINGKLRPGIVHRIDKDTSGLLMVAKNDLTHQGLAEQLKEHTIKRAYLALTEGVIMEPGGIIDAPIGRHPVDRKKRAVTAKNSKEAVTRYMVKERFTNNTLIECQLETGRTHQIRVHLAYINHPLVGDPLYGYRKQSLEFPGQALHAYLLGFIHPRSQEYLEFTAPLPENFSAVLNKLRKEEEE